MSIKAQLPADSGFEGGFCSKCGHYAAHNAWQTCPVCFGKGLPAEDVAAVLGHRDRGDLIRRVYGHFEHESALERVKAAVAASDELAVRRAVA